MAHIARRSGRSLGLGVAVLVLAVLFVSCKSSAAPRRADVLVSGLTVSPSQVSAGATAQASGSVTNRGRSDAASVQVTFWLTSDQSKWPTTSGAIQLASVTLGTVAGGQSVSFTVSLSIPSGTTPGEHYVQALVQTSSQESNGTNNLASQPLNIASTSGTTSASASGTSSSSTTSGTGGSSSGSASFKYQAFFDGVLAANAGTFDGMAASGVGLTYYSFSYVLDGMLGMYEGTRHSPYLERALGWAETMVSRATIVDYAGRRNWAGEWASPYASIPISYQLEDLQGSVELARLARIILTDGSLRGTYGSRAEAIYSFVRDHIVDKWLYVRGGEGWFRDNAATPSLPFSDKTAILARILMDLHRAASNSGYATLASDLVSGFRDRLVGYAGDALVWDLGIGDSLAGHSMDTAHANRIPWMIAGAVNGGIGLSDAHATGVARLLAQVIWDQSSASPRFTNFIDGDNSTVFGRGAWGNGLIYSGWLALGGWDARVQALGEATLDAIIGGVSNPSLDYMDTVYGHMALAGHLTRNDAGVR